MRGYIECIEYLKENRNKRIEPMGVRILPKDRFADSWKQVWIDDDGKLQMCIAHYFYEHNRDPHIRTRCHQPFNEIMDFEKYDWVKIKDNEGDKR